MNGKHDIERETIESGSLLALIADNLPLLIAYVDSDQVYRFVNRHYGRWLGLDPSEIVGRRVPDVLGPERYAVIRAKVQEVLSGIPVAYETHMPLPDGRRVHYQARYIPHRSAAGAVLGFFLMVEDIGDRVKAAEQMERQARRLSDQVRNLRCLHEISALREEKGLTGWRDYLKGIADLLPTALRFPENACARITVNGEIFPSKQFCETAWCIERPVTVYGATAGNWRCATGKNDRLPARHRSRPRSAG